MKRLAMVALLAFGSCQPVDFEFADGTTGSYSDWRGHWIVINYWAEWCAPCRHEIPELNALNLALGGHETQVIGVNYDGIDGAALRALIQRMGIDFPVMNRDPRARYGYDLPAVLPTTVVIDPKGTVVATLVGPQTQTSLKSALGISEPL